MEAKTKIRKYIQQLTEANVDVGGRVFTRRPSPLFTGELPSVLIHYGSEPMTIYTGDRFNPREMKRDLQIVIDVMVHDTIDPDAEEDKNTVGEDFLDDLSGVIESLLNFDHTLGRLLKDYDPETGDGLSMGLRQLSATPYTDDGGERRILLNRLVFEVPYIDCTLRDVRLADFTNYHIYFTKEGDDITDPDNIAREAEGDPRENQS